MNVKGMRRMSSLRDGAPAYPHIDVPDQVLYRHCSDQAPPVVRMKHLLNWTLHRSIPQALGEEALPRLGKSATRSREVALLQPIPAHAASALTDQEKQKFAETAPILRKVIDDTLRDLNDGLIGISWLRQSKDQEHRSLQPHPRNQSNAHAAQQLEGMQRQLQAELEAWEEHEAGVQQLHAEADRFEMLAAQAREQNARGKARSTPDEDADEDHAIAAEIERALSGAVDGDEEAPQWTAADLDDVTRAQLELADNVLQSVDDLNAAVVAKQQDEPGAEIPGTETDAHLRTLEFSIDRLQTRLHTISQLDEVASKYLGQVATRASQALQERTSAGLASFAAPHGEEEGAEPSEQQRLDRLLAGVREPSESAAPDAAATHTDTRELLRALARPK
ncbi:hypothetical protein MOBT1_001760 [Malassezia obtusa]|uniref:Uncharacterized protein n=1 Tax=Malassezia obtusa TaxID=76774 RepID=A0AAF0E0I5_9BASI|nr:hypothetical protein MOBT1_001760 [Malassezia obtusa]